MNPLNYDKMFDSLKVLFNPSIQDVSVKKEELKNLVLRKDYIGEFCWYLYTAIFLTSVVSYNTASMGCNKSMATLQSNYNEHVEKTETIQKENGVLTGQLYS
jgi:hypothetical protein